MIIELEKNDTKEAVMIAEALMAIGLVSRIVGEDCNQSDDRPCCESYDDGKSAVKFCKGFTEAACEQAMPELQKTFDGRNACDWVCLFHVLLFYGYIECSDFNEFCRWLSLKAGREIITAVHARTIKREYWVKAAGIMWSLPDALKELNTTRQEKKFVCYCKLCVEIKSIIDRAIKSSSVVINTDTDNAATTH